MRCSQAADWLQLYLDGRLETRRLAQLERHIHECAQCRHELALFETVRVSLVAREPEAEAPNLEHAIRGRIAAYEVRRAAELEARQAANRAWRERRWQAAALVALVALIYLLLPQGTQSSLSATLERGWPGILQALTSPGPDSVAWAAWVVGGLAVFLLALYVARADASAGLRRSIAQRLPQLW